MPSDASPKFPLTPIPTYYKDCKFRSRLEARWAVFFDAPSIAWEYEKEGYDINGTWYLPDFWLSNVRDRHGLVGVWVEIKGNGATPEESKLCGGLAVGTHHSAHIFSGQPQTQDSVGESGLWFGPNTEYGPGWDNYMAFHYCSFCRAAKIEFLNDYFHCFECHRMMSSTWKNNEILEAISKAKSARF